MADLLSIEITREPNKTDYKVGDEGYFIDNCLKNANLRSNPYVLNKENNSVAAVAASALIVIITLISFVSLNDATGVGVIDDISLVVLIPLFFILGGSLNEQ